MLIILLLFITYMYLVLSLDYVKPYAYVVQ